MMTWVQFKTGIRQTLWAGNEASNLVAGHDKFFVDAIVDIQKWVECQQQNNTDIIAQCSTMWKCGITVTGCPRGRIKKVSVVDQINPITHKEDPTAQIDWCSEITYNQVEPMHIARYLWEFQHQRNQPWSFIPVFFGLDPLQCGFRPYPTPTDAGLQAGLASLPVGYHYGQASTDRPHGRSYQGVWAIERGNLFVVPWIQSTESILAKWDGIKRSWNPSDLVDDDPMLSKAVLEYVRWKDLDIYQESPDKAALALQCYTEARLELWHECQKENRVVSPEEHSYARGDFGSLSSIGQGATPAGGGSGGGSSGGSSGGGSGSGGGGSTPVTPVTPVAPVTPVTPTTTIFWNTAQPNVVLSCQRTDPNAPAPIGTTVTLPVPAGIASSPNSQQEANLLATQQVQAAATAKLSCTYYNSAQLGTATCQDGSTQNYTMAAGRYSASDQATANALALAQANSAAAQQCMVTAGNTQQIVQVARTFTNFITGATCIVQVHVTVPANYVFGSGIGGAAGTNANDAAQQVGQTFGNSVGIASCQPSILRVTL